MSSTIFGACASPNPLRKGTGEGGNRRFLIPQPVPEDGVEDLDARL